MAKTKGPTPSEKAAAMRAANLQKAAAPSPVTSDGRPVRQAKSTAYKNQGSLFLAIITVGVR